MAIPVISLLPATRLRVTGWSTATPFRPFGVRDTNETVSAEFIGRRLDGLQNNVSGLNRRMITLESNLIDRVGALEARMAGFEDRTDQLVERFGALATGVNTLVLLVERIAKAQGLVIESDAQVLRSPLG